VKSIEPPIYGTYDPSLIIPEVCAGEMGLSQLKAGVSSLPKLVLMLLMVPIQGAVGQTTFDFTNLTGGTHTVYIQDASNCAAEFRSTIRSSEAAQYHRQILSRASTAP
jgi:hypothetical protein